MSDAGGEFLHVCEGDDDCGEAGKCLSFGDVKRCSRLCGALQPCPTAGGWSCEQEQCRCSPSPSGKVTDRCDVDGDCDGVADRPAAAEVCNDVDDDCNGAVDDVAAGVAGARIYYRDEDGDGFGAVDNLRWLCKSQPGWVEDLGDCDDARKEDNPGATEICGDAFDNDCDGKLEDTDVCGLSPIDCPAGIAVEDAKCLSATLTQCGKSVGVKESADISEIVFKQDSSRIKFTVRLAGSPAAAGCVAYRLGFGDPAQSGEALAYVVRLPKDSCEAAGFLAVEAQYQGQSFSSTVVPGSLVVPAGDPGHVSFTLDKDELYQRVAKPTYRVRACTVEPAAGAADLSSCATDSCEAKAHL